MLILLLAAMLVLLNAAASLQVWNRPDVPPPQRVAQLLLVWLLPVVGALLCLVFVAMTRAGDGGGSDPGPSYVNDSGYAWGEGDNGGTRCAADIDSCDGGGDSGGGDGGGGGD